MRVLRLQALFCLLICFWCAPSNTANGEPVRRAFIVGISDYSDVALALKGPKNDAPLIARQLSQFDYKHVTLVEEENTTFAKLSARWNKFKDSVNKGDHVVIYFSGHGVSVGNVNYLVARDFQRSDMAESANADRLKLFSIERWRADLVEKKAAVSVWILDACRNNGIGLERGLRTLKPLSGNLIMYSAAAGQESSDATDKKDPSAYTKYLLAGLKQLARQDAVVLARVVQSEVAKAYSDQLPEISSLMRDSWCFNNCDPKNIISLRFETVEGAFESPSKHAFSKSKSIKPALRRQNAVFVGTASQARSCSSDIRFECPVLKDFVAQKFDGYLGKQIKPLQTVAIFRRPPIVKDTINYLCEVGSITENDSIEVTGVLSFEYKNETYFWATIKERRESCLGRSHRKV